MVELLDSINEHVSLMHLQLYKTLQDSAHIIDNETIAVLKNSIEITEDKFPEQKKKNIFQNKATLFDEVLEAFLNNQSDQHFTLPEFGSIKIIEFFRVHRFGKKAYNNP